MVDLTFLTRRPVAHRGLHDRAAGRIENTAAAVEAAIAADYAVEVDVQLSHDNEAMVFHDATLDRLTRASGRLEDLNSSALRRVPFRESDEHMMSLPELLGRVAGRTPLLIEIKGDMSGDLRLARRTARLASTYRGPCALMSFDPRVVAALAQFAPLVPRGIVAQRESVDGNATFGQRLALAHLLHWRASRFQFIAYRVGDLPTLATRVARLASVPVLAWTVRTPAERERARASADQMIFEGFTP